LGDHSKKNEIDKSCGTNSRQERCKLFWQGDMREREHLEDLGIESIMLKWIFKKGDGEAWTGCVWLRIGTADCHLLMQQ
jgi:hypothetical protein